MLTNMLLHSYQTTVDSSEFYSSSSSSSNSTHFNFYDQSFIMMKQEDVETPRESPDSDEQLETTTTVVGKLQSQPQTIGRLCEVCSNPGATSHYGGIVCGGCKIFFSRTVQSRKGFVCERGGICKMNAGKRAKCRACRYQLCLKAHMSPEEVGRLRDMRMGDYTAMVKKEGSVVGYYEEGYQPSTSIHDCASRIISFIDVYAFTNSEMTALSFLVNLERNLDNNAQSVDLAQFPKHCNASFPIREAIDFPFPLCDRIPTNFARRKFLEDPRGNTKIFWCRNVLHFIEWANSTQDLGNFTRHEKMLLIAENFLSIACLTTFYGFLKIQREEFELGEEGTVPPPCSIEWFAEFAKIAPEAESSVRRVISEVLEPMDALDITMEELVIMKYIMFFNGNEPSKVRSMSDCHRIHCYRLKYCELLQKYIKRNVPDPSQRINRISELLRIIEAVRGISIVLDKWLLMFYTSNVCELNDVLVYDFHVRAWNEVAVDNTSTSSTWNTNWNSLQLQATLQ